VGTLPVSQTLPCTLLLSTLQTVARREDFGVIETQGHISRRWTMLFSWLRRRRRRKLLAEPFPQEWLGYLQSNVAHYANLDEVDKTQLRDDLRVFIAEKRWEGCGGLQLTDEMKITIAAHACLLVLHLPPGDHYARVTSILIYPRGFLIPSQYRGTDVLFEPDNAASGQAVYRGPVIISWQDALNEGRNPQEGRNVVFHEFAH